MSGDAYFEARLPADPRRRVLWQTLYRHCFARWHGPEDCVLELGCGYGDFINAVRARRRVAVDGWSGSAGHLEPGVEFRAGPLHELSFLADRSVHFALASNVFEHLTREELRATLAELRRVLHPEGSLCIVQPNWRHAWRHYFDDYTHVAVYSHVSLCDLLRAEGFEILACVPRFLPLTVKSRLPVHPLLIRLYLALPWRPLARQMLVRCRPSRRS